MADIRLAKPVAGTTQTVPSAPDGRFIFDFPADAATLTRNGDDLVLSFEDGSSIRLQGFYTTYSKEEMPSFQVEGVEISGQDFFAALGEDLMPAAGPAAGSSASRGGRFDILPRLKAGDSQRRQSCDCILKRFRFSEYPAKNFGNRT